MRSVLKKETRTGEETIDFFSRQEFPILLNTYNREEVKRKLDEEINKKKEELAGWVERGSGWVLDKINTAYLDFARNVPITGASYIPTPKELKNKNAIINVKNRDNDCLRWSLRSAFFPAARNPDRPNNYPTEDGFDLTGISFPTPLHEIPKVEKLNNIAINVLGWKNGKAVIYHISEMYGKDIPCVNLMLITRQNNNHYCYIKNLGRLLRVQH